VGLLGAGCVEPWDLDNRRFPCRAETDCVEGFTCHPDDFVCVPTGSVDASATASDARPRLDADARIPDATMTPTVAPDAGLLPMLGETCTGPCGEGTCVDGFCCNRACDGPCERCDQTPGQCEAAAAGTDPDDDCDGAFECADVLFGLDGGECFACPAAAAPSGTCDGAGACRPDGCTCDVAGAQVSRCRNADCIRADACPAGTRTALFDERVELCAIGEACGGAFAGCCSARGACCPAPMCADDDALCQ